jgi:FkbM family methyltransferase
MPVPLVRNFSEFIRTKPALARLALRLVPDLPVSRRLDHVGPFRIRLRRHRALWLRDPINSESRPMEALQHLVREGDVVWDIGANIGLYARFLLRSTPAARVVSFEPMPDNLRDLRANLDRRRIGADADRVQVVEAAVSDADGDADFQVDDVMSASARLDAVDTGRAAAGRAQIGLPPLTTCVRTARIDTMVEQGALPRPDVLKIDVEGAELLVLAGGEDVLRKHGPRLVIETHGLEVAKATARRLLALGYHLRGFAPAPRSQLLGPTGFGRVTHETTDAATDFYDLHFLIASQDESDLMETVPTLQPPANA